MASRLKDRNKYGASLPKPPKCGEGKKAVWIEEKKTKSKETDGPGEKVAREDRDKPIHGKGKWVCKTKTIDKKPTDKPDTPKVYGASQKEPRGTKEEKAQRRVSKRSEKVAKRIKKTTEKSERKADKAIAREEAGKITRALADQKINKAYNKNMNKARLTYGSKKDAKSIVKKVKNK